VLTSGQGRAAYPDAIRDWVEKGADSPYALSPAEVVARSQPRSMSASESAAHFELANHFGGPGDGISPSLTSTSPVGSSGNWTWKRQAWSLVGNERVGGEFAVRGGEGSPAGPMPGQVVSYSCQPSTLLSRRPFCEAVFRWSVDSDRG
jgi:hypothetical protein